jgi:hypothetical protein
VTRRLLSTIVTLAWGLWFGGMVMLFATLATIFGTPGFDREARGAFAAGLFPVFERMQLVFAAVTLLGTAGWWFASRTKLKLVLFALFAVATIAAVAETSMVAPRIEALRVGRLRDTPEFDRMHQLSTGVYTAGAAVLLIAGLILPAAIRADDAVKPPWSRTSEETPAG